MRGCGGNLNDNNETDTAIHRAGHGLTYARGRRRARESRRGYAGRIKKGDEMNGIFLFSFVFFLQLLVVREVIFDVFSMRKKKEEIQLVEPFSVLEYFDRIEKAALDILEKQDPVNKTITLWWGLDGLRLNEDGSLEWISRKKPKPVNQNISYQMCQSMKHLPQFDMSQSTQATREQIYALKMQLYMENFNIAMQKQMQGFNSALQSYVVPTPGYIGYSPYMQPPYLQSAFAPQLTQCCCDPSFGRTMRGKIIRE